MPVAADQDRTAGVAESRLRRLVVDVAGVDVAQPVRDRDAPRLEERLRRSVRLIQHLVVGVEGREVQRHVRPQVLHEPVAERSDLRGRVVLARNQERGDLEPYIGLALEVDQRLQHRLEPACAEAVVEALGERLQVDVGRVHAVEELPPRLGADVAGGDGDVPEPARAAGLGDVDRVLEEDHRVVVGVGDRPAAAPHGRFGDLLRRGPSLEPVEFARLGDVPVLAELAGEVAARGAEGEHRRAGQEVGERLLLDRVDAEARGAAVGGEDDAVALPGAHEAQAALALVQLAQAGADVALHAPVVEQVPVAAGRAGDDLGAGLV